MRDRPQIFAGLLIFVALFTFPAWRGKLDGSKAQQPVLTLPTAQKHCVLPKEEMRGRHMQLLIQWREDKVRKGITTYTAYDGTVYPASLTRTCLGQCHTNKAEFCDRCHQFSGVSGPYCFDCHVDPSKGANVAAAAPAPAPAQQPTMLASHEADSAVRSAR